MQHLDNQQRARTVELWRILPMEIRAQSSYRTYHPEEVFYASREEAEVARQTVGGQYPDKGTLVAPVLLISLSHGKIILNCGTLSNAEEKTQEVFALARDLDLDAQMVWELGLIG